ncbi:MAG: HupE/UreJ family protein [Burkholderiaceae bacterium]
MKRLLLALLLFCSASAWAHKPSDAYLFVVTEGAQLSARWDVALRDLDAALDLDANANRELTWGEVTQQLPAITALMANSLRMERSDQSCNLQWSGFVTQQRSDGNYLVATAGTTCGARGQPLAITYRLFAALDATHRAVVSATIDGQAITAVLDPGAEQASTLNAQASNSFWLFLADGMHHILIGWDHILFLLCLILPCVLVRDGAAWQAAPRLMPVVKRIAITVTAFTLAHSVTLTLAAFEIVQLPPRLIESLIAATVIFAAVNNIVPLVRERIALMALAFGFIHGFGFANVLAELSLPRESFAWALLAFNLGVELGQLLIVGAALLVLYPLRGMRLYTPAILKGGSITAALLASLWLVERVFDLSILSA